MTFRLLMIIKEMLAQVVIIPNSGENSGFIPNLYLSNTVDPTSPNSMTRAFKMDVNGQIFENEVESDTLSSFDILNSAKTEDDVSNTKSSNPSNFLIENFIDDVSNDEIHCKLKPNDDLTFEEIEDLTGIVPDDIYEDKPSIRYRREVEEFLLSDDSKDDVTGFRTTGTNAFVHDELGIHVSHNIMLNTLQTLEQIDDHLLSIDRNLRKGAVLMKLGAITTTMFFMKLCRMFAGYINSRRNSITFTKNSNGGFSVSADVIGQFNRVFNRDSEKRKVDEILDESDPQFVRALKARLKQSFNSQRKKGKPK
jgi:hypothetical protein